VFDQHYPVTEAWNDMPGVETMPVDVSLVIKVLYGAGVATSLLITFLSVVRMLRIYKSSRKFIQSGRTIAVNPDHQPFSFFGLLFLRSANDDAMIIEHELVHIRQHHWIDLVVVEIAAAVLWFNPCIYFYRKSMAIQHEYIADRSVVKNVPVKEYLQCIARQLETNLQATLVSNFNSQSIKQRIIMITNPKTYSALRYAVVLPVIAALTMAFANRPSIQNGDFRSPVDVTKLRKEPGAGFGKRVNPITRKEQFHTGVDLITARGNSVYAPARGVVAKTSTTGDRGNFILITHDNKLTTSYSHLEKIHVKEGDQLSQGQLIGLVGSTGLSTGPHLHFEIWKEGKAVDPVPYLDMSN
jgi:hypothetical protein